MQRGVSTPNTRIRTRANAHQEIHASLMLAASIAEYVHAFAAQKEALKSRPCFCSVGSAIAKELTKHLCTTERFGRCPLERPSFAHRFCRSYLFGPFPRLKLVVDVFMRYKSWMVFIVQLHQSPKLAIKHSIYQPDVHPVEHQRTHWFEFEIIVVQDRMWIERPAQVLLQCL